MTMSDCFPAWIEIGGPVPTTLVPALLEHVHNEGLRWNWTEDAVKATTAEELIAELRQHDTDVLRAGHDEARYGSFDDLEAFLVRHGIAFDRQSDAKCEHDARLLRFRPGMSEPYQSLATQAGVPVIEVEDLRPIQQLLQQGDHEEAQRRLAQLLDPVPPLPPLTIVEETP
jgi:hypothetical protein